MVSLRKNRKGMIAIIDALVFLALLSLVTVGLFAYSSVSDTEDPLAKTVAEELFETEIRVNDLCRGNDNQVEPLYIIIAVNLNNGDTNATERFIEDTLDVLIPEFYGYDLTVGYKGNTMNIHRDSDRELSSEYEMKRIIRDGNEMTVALSVY